MSMKLTKEDREWADKVKDRDGRKCVICGETDRLNAHHKISFSEIIEKFNIKTIEDARKCKILWDINNGITLCKSCHDKHHSVHGR